MYCKQCGKMLGENEAFCISCGTPRAGFQPSATELDATPEPAKRRKPMLIGAIAAVVIAIGIAIGFFVSTPIGQEVSRDLGVEVFSEPEYKVSKRTTVTGKGLTTVESFSYDGEGRLTETQTTKEYEDDSGEVRIANYKESITYISDSDSVYEKSVDNAEDDADNGSFRKTVHRALNDKEDPIESTIEEYDGTSTTTSATYEYHPNGEKKSYIIDYTYSVDVSEKHLYKHLECTFDENGKPLENHIEYTDDVVTDESYKRSEDGTPITRVWRYASGSYDSTTTYHYDEYGNAASETHDDGTESEYELTLDNEGKVLRKYQPQVNYKGGGASGKIINEYQYDNNGNTIYVKYESYGVDSNEPGDWSYEVYTEYVRV